MALPGVNVTVDDAASGGSLPSDTGTAFVVGLSDRGAVDAPIPVRSLSDARRKIGARVPYGVTLDALETFFREGGKTAYVGRVVGPDAVASTADLSDGSNPTLTVTAASPGEWGDNLEVEVVEGTEGGTFRLIVSDNGTVVASSSDLASTADAVAWANNTAYIRLEDLGEGDPEEQTVSLADGDDDRANITVDEVNVALALFASDLGTGQVLYPGATDEDSQAALVNHAADNNRVALLDGEDTADVATLVGQASDARSTGNGRNAALFAPWAVIPGLTAGTTRTVPYSAVQAGLIARSDSNSGNPNLAVAGENGVARFATGLARTFSDDDRESLNDAGVTVAVVKFGQVRTYGTRSVANPVTEDNWIQFQNGRLAASIAATAEQIAEAYLFDQIDGRGVKLAEFAGDLQGILLPLYQLGALYGATPEEAFVVDVDSVNTDETAADGELNAAIAVKMSPAAERVVISISKVRTEEAI